MLLALDTATATASIAVYDLTTSHLLAELTWQARRRQTQDLLGAARHLLAQVDLTPQSITALAVTTGPGSFTGVRIGISAVKGIALGLPAPPKVIGIPTLNMTAAPWLQAARRLSALTICAYMQAGRGRYNWSFLTPNNPWTRLEAADHHNGTLQELVADLQRQPIDLIWLIGEATAEVSELTSALSNVVLLDEATSWRRAGHLAQLAKCYFEQGVEDLLVNLQPIYLRQP